MRHLRATLALPSSLIALQILLLTQPSVAADVPYPAAQPCFDSATASAKCDKSTSASFNSCACKNTGNWLGNSAACIGQKDGSQLTAIYNTLKANCAGTNTPIAYSLDKWLAAANVETSATGTTNAATSVKTATSVISATSVVSSISTQTESVVSTITDATTAEPTSTPPTSASSKSGSSPASAGSVVTVTATPAASTSKSGSKIKTPAIIGIVIGILGLLAILGLIFFLYRRRKNSQIYEVNEAAYVPPAETAQVGKTRPISTATALSEPVSQLSGQYKRYSPQQPMGFPSPPDSPTNAHYPQAQPPQQGYYTQPYNPNAHELQGPPVPRYYELPTGR